MFIVDETTHLTGKSESGDVLSSGSLHELSRLTGSRGLDEGRARDGLGTLRRGEGGGGGDFAFGGGA